MRATKVLQKCREGAHVGMRACRQRVLVRAVGALIVGRRSTLMDVARAWSVAERVRAPLKSLDRLLSNGQLHAGTISFLQWRSWLTIAGMAACRRYIELDPVRAWMVAQPDECPWSSFGVNAWGTADGLLAPHAC